MPQDKLPQAKQVATIRLAEGLSLYEAFHYPGARFIYRTAWEELGKSVRVGRDVSHFSMITIEDAFAKDWYVEQ